MTRTERGRLAEDHALSHLLNAGLKLVDRNYRSRFGEIDLIMEEVTTVVFVEVRYRSSDRFGSAQESVNQKKQQRIILTASYFIKDKRIRQPTRFDVAAITPGPSGFSMNWIKGAFNAE
ncbi:MAG: hypothetical protein RL661_301 [Pseudomonadota bacterium]|jgi:putative endonuclease